MCLNKSNNVSPAEGDVTLKITAILIDVSTNHSIFPIHKLATRGPRSRPGRLPRRFPGS